MSLPRKIALAALLASGACCPPPGTSSVVPPPRPSAVPAPPPAPSAKVEPVTAAKGPPVARREDVFDMLHGTRVDDPYRWLEDGKSREVQEWLMMNDAHTRVHLSFLSGRDELEKRLTDLSYLESVSPPSRRGNRYFFTRRHKDKEKVVHYWREGKNGAAKVLLDPNTMSSDGSTSINDVSPSFDGRWVAFNKNENNADEAVMYVMDVKTGKVSDVDTIKGTRYGWASWDPKGTGFYYTRLPEVGAVKTEDRPGYAQVFFHKLGTDYQTDQLIADKTGDPKIFIGGYVSRDGNYLFLYKHFGWSSSEIQFKDLRKHTDWQPLAVGHDAKFDAYAWKDKLYVKTDKGAPRGKLYVVDPAKPEMSAWKEIVPERSDVLEDFQIIGNQLVLTYLVNASSRVEIADLDGKVQRTLDLPGIGSVYGPVGNPDDDAAYYGYYSFTQPTIIYETSIKKGGNKEWFKLDVDVDPEPYTVEQVWYPSKDGTKISMFVIRRKDMAMDGSTPMLLTGYGGFSSNQTPYFAASYYPFLDKGGAIAIPNLRGGGEYGEEWHRAGMLDKKQNVFDDFIAAAQFLFDKGYTKAERLAIRGASNGGLLVGAAMVQRPEMFRAVICGVPLLDMVRYDKFESGKTWISEFGSADDPAQFKALYAYSPYHHVKKGTKYPAMMMLSADHDDRVDPNHARKFTAAIRWANGGDSHILLRVESHAGHGGGDMVKKNVELNTDVYAFLFDELGMNAKEP
jgi:prolyl oligopeptidase